MYRTQKHTKRFPKLPRLASRKLTLVMAGSVFGMAMLALQLQVGSAAQPASQRLGADGGIVLTAQQAADRQQANQSAVAKPSTTSSTPAPAVSKTSLTPAPTVVSGGLVAPSGSIGLPLYVDPSNSASVYATAYPGAAGAGLIARLGQQPVAEWFGGWSSAADVSAYVGRAAAAQALPVLVAYDIPNRDCGGYSAGGAQTEADYAAWVQQLAAGIAGRPALVILEPDAIALQTCLSADQLAARNRELTSAVHLLAATGARVYLDAGHSGWLSPSESANRLRAAGVAQASGFALNVSNFATTSSNVAYGNQVSALVGSKHYVIDTSRNGTGPAADSQWCNPAGRALGALPTTNTGNGLADAYLWVKTPWESDGACMGHPAAGQDDWAYAISLAQAAGW